PLTVSHWPGAGRATSEPSPSGNPKEGIRGPGSAPAGNSGDSGRAATGALCKGSGRGTRTSTRVPPGTGRGTSSGPPGTPRETPVTAKRNRSCPDLISTGSSTRPVKETGPRG